MYVYRSTYIYICDCMFQTVLSLSMAEMIMPSLLHQHHAAACIKDPPPAFHNCIISHHVVMGGNIDPKMTLAARSNSTQVHNSNQCCMVWEFGIAKKNTARMVVCSGSPF